MERPRTAKEKKVFKEADQMVTALGKRWDGAGVFIMVAFATPTGNPDEPDEHNVAVLNVAGGSDAFKKNLPRLLRGSADRAEKDGELSEKPGDFPKLLTDLLRRDEPDTN